MELPNFCEYSGPALTLIPPFQFTDVTVTVFPLRAEADTLQRFVDSYINIVPPEVGIFRVSMPYVYLMLLDYGRLAAQTTNFGCFSQRELVFSVPLDWYRRNDGRLVFHDWASVAPFIYVDGQISLSVGRTSMGWPKSLVKVTPELSGWLQEPDGLTTDISMSAQVFSKVYAGGSMEEQPVLKVRSPMPATLRVPLDARDPMAPWNTWTSMARSTLGLTQDYFRWLRTSGLMPPTAEASPENLALKLRKGLGASMQSLPWAPNVAFNSINLKQFRRADDTTRPCYQALTCGPLRYTSFMRGGLLGNQLGDTSGGYVVDLACFPTFPVADALGLDAETYDVASGPSSVRLKPVFPYWYEVNMEYAATRTLAFRDQDGEWCDDAGKRIGTARETEAKKVYFNTAIGAASPVVTGPFEFTSSTVRLLTVSAKITSLQTYLDEWLNLPLENLKDAKERFELWYDPAGMGRKTCPIYVAIVDWGDVTSKTNSIGDWAGTTLTFYIPVKHMRDGQVVGLGLFPAYSFAESTIQSCTLTELYGVPTVQGSFGSGGNSGDLEGLGEINVLRLDIESLPALHEGQMVETKTLVDFVDTGQPIPRNLPKQEGEPGMLGNGITVYTMKQFRDVANSDKACYQALVTIRHKVRVYEVLEVPRAAQLRIHRLAMYPICKKLGLTHVSSSKAGRSEGEQSVDVYRWLVMKADINIGKGVQLFERIGLEWRRNPTAKQASAPPTQFVDDGPEQLLMEDVRRFPSHPPAAWEPPA
jgi:hypothetical protein